jgi:hypothetical protein
MIKLPAGTTSICGQSLHSWNVFFGFSDRSCVGDNGAAVIDSAGEVPPAQSSAMLAKPHTEKIILIVNIVASRPENSLIGLLPGREYVRILVTVTVLFSVRPPRPLRVWKH